MEIHEVERYELAAGPAYRFAADRREFVQTLGAGLVIAVGARSATAQRGGRGRSGGDDATISLERRFHIDRDGIVTALTSKVEVGQGSRTQISQAVAEELRVPLVQVRLIMADTQLCPDDGGTAGSRTTPSTVPSVRRAAAQAREALIALAAARWQVEPGSVQMHDGQFAHAESTRQTTLADLAADKAFAERWTTAAPAGDVVLTPVDQWRVLGVSAPKTPGRDVATGAHQYPSDIRRPGMVYGKVLRPPGYGATLQSIDLTAADALAGVQAVRDGDFVGCTGATSWQAAQAIAELAETAVWDIPQHPSSDELFNHLRRTARIDQARENRRGDGDDALTYGTQRYEATFTVAYIQHAPLEPRAAVAEWTDGRLTVWTGTQQPARAQSELMQAFRLSADRVRVIVPDTGGGFGGKHSGEAALEAARLARHAGRPVSLRLTREEECAWAYCRPAGVIDVAATLDAAARLLAWDMTNYNSGESALASPYDSPHSRTRFVPADSPLRQGSYRALASTANTFARESAIDELAALVGADLSHLPDGRLKDVLVAAAERFGWAERRRAAAPPRGVGLACGTDKGSFVAACVEVEYDGYELHILEACHAFECGAIQNPRNLQSQVEGAILQGLGGALWENVVFRDGRIVNDNFSRYRVPRLADVPPLEIVLLDRPDLPSVGAGETPIIAIAPALANAMTHAGGKRRRNMPLLK
ncbi:MAG TPA: molybdopterin-dependent oxidoreductase [Lacipirellulaceae bacterium]|nr:molybdopterin-dependent oxidoreductase [Lacipirellulaceae bacterium]